MSESGENLTTDWYIFTLISKVVGPQAKTKGRMKVFEMNHFIIGLKCEMGSKWVINPPAIYLNTDSVVDDDDVYNTDTTKISAVDEM